MLPSHLHSIWQFEFALEAGKKESGYSGLQSRPLILISSFIIIEEVFFVFAEGKPFTKSIAKITANTTNTFENFILRFNMLLCSLDKIESNERT